MDLNGDHGAALAFLDDVRSRSNQISDPAFFDSVERAFSARDVNSCEKENENANVACLQLMYHAIARCDFEAVVELCTSDVTLEILGPESIPFVGRWEGREEVLQAMRNNFSLLEEQNPEIRTLVAQGDIVIVIAHETGRIKSSGLPYSVNWVQEFTFDNGRLSYVRELVDGGADFPPM